MSLDVTDFSRAGRITRGRKDKPMTTPTTQTDRSARAIEIIRAGLIEAHTETSDIWTCKSQSAGSLTPVYYGVTTRTCTCDDFRKHGHICKHLWAGPGRNTALLIWKLRRASSLQFPDQQRRVAT